MRRFITIALVGACTLTTVFGSTVSVKADAKTYTVTYRAGNVGSFDSTTVSEYSVGNGGITGVDVTARGSIKLTVAAGSKVPNAPTHINVNDGYFAVNSSEWGPTEGETVDRNVDYVVDYGKLTEGVEYTVKYVDESSGESIAPSYITKDNVGNTRKVKAPSIIKVSNGVIYTLTSDSTITKKIDSKSENNVFVFKYKYDPDQLITYTDETVYVGGEVETVYVDSGEEPTVISTDAGVAGVRVEQEPQVETTVVQPRGVAGVRVERAATDNTAATKTAADNEADEASDDEADEESTKSASVKESDSKAIDKNQEMVGNADLDKNAELTGENTEEVTVDSETAADSKEDAQIVDKDELEDEVPLAQSPKSDSTQKFFIATLATTLVALFAAFVVWLKSRQRKKELADSFKDSAKKSDRY